MKKNKTGFTLIELLAVLVVLSLIMIIAVPSIQKAMSNAKTGISNLNKKNLTEAGKTLATEIQLCDSSDPNDINQMKNIFKDNSAANCSSAKTKLNGGFDVTVDDLKTWGYFEDTSNNCLGTLNISADANTEKVTVNLDSVKCKK